VGLRTTKSEFQRFLSSPHFAKESVPVPASVLECVSFSRALATLILRWQLDGTRQPRVTFGKVSEAFYTGNRTFDGTIAFCTPPDRPNA